MFLIREVMHCKPGKVRDMVQKFKAVSAVMQKLGFAPFRVYTDVSGERFWTVAAEHETANLNEFMAMLDKVMSDEAAQRAMAGYHELVEGGHREIYKVEG